MSTRVLRQKPRIDYYEPQEPTFDEYIYCERCSDYVFEYCAIHGPLLVIPDDKVSPIPKFPSYVPRAALTIPHVFLHLAPSVIPGAGIGVFSTLTLPCGVRFGPYLGNRTSSVDSSYCWQIFDRNNRPSHVLDAADPHCSNWMRYVNCSRHQTEQNLVAYQYKGQLYYRTIKIIPRFTELLVFYGSEFANALSVNLSKYNDVPYYKQVINPPKMVAGISQASTNSEYYSMGNDENIAQKMYNNDELNFNDFKFIDEPVLTQNAPNFIDVSKEKSNSVGRFQCDQCVRSFLKKDNLRRHLLSHSTSPKYRCAICSYSTSLSYSFKRHNLIHSKNKVLDFTDVSKETIKNNSGQRFQCEDCNKTFLKKKYLKIHLLSHLTTPKYQCPICSYTTSVSYTFKKHVLTHSKRVYSCDMCSYTTKISKNFIAHSSHHENSSSKSYYLVPKQCEVCQFSTCSRKSFQTHMLRHKGILHQCQICDYSNYSKSNFNKHLLKKHNT